MIKLIIKTKQNNSIKMKEWVKLEIKKFWEQKLIKIKIKFLPKLMVW
jgi:hypothetical protein